MIYSALAGIYNKTGMMFGIVSNSFTTAGSSMIGQNLGAGRNERVPKILGVVLSIGMGMATVFSALLLLFQLPARVGMEQTDREIIQLMLDPVSEEQETR
jgi:Na+-driven multidrug efflux pump